jgi:hypothetical protein
MFRIAESDGDVVTDERILSPTGAWSWRSGHGILRSSDPEWHGVLLSLHPFVEAHLLHDLADDVLVHSHLDSLELDVRLDERNFQPE